MTLRETFLYIQTQLPAVPSPQTQINSGFTIGVITWISHWLEVISPIASEIAAICAAIIGVVGVFRLVAGWFSKRHVIEVPSNVNIRVQKSPTEDHPAPDASPTPPAV